MRLTFINIPSVNKPQTPAKFQIPIISATICIRELQQTGSKFLEEGRKSGQNWWFFWIFLWSMTYLPNINSLKETSLQYTNNGFKAGKRILKIKQI